MVIELYRRYGFMLVSIAEIFKAVFLGIVEGITEWLPISSTGHMLLVDEFLQLDMSEEFKEMFFVVIQLGAILAVISVFFKRMIPFEINNGLKIKKDTFSLWVKVVIACVPGAVVTLLFDDFIDAHLHTPIVIALMLIIYGVAFIAVENMAKNKTARTNKLEMISYKEALLIGLFQVLSIIPGTSRSGATIIGALIIGVSRVAAAEFTFFLAVPVMFGLSTIKLLDFGFSFTTDEIVILLVGCVTAFAVSLGVVKFLMSYIKKKDFKAFGVYRIILGLLVLVYFLAVK